MRCRHARLVPLPDGVATRDAAALMLQGMTAHYLATSTYPLAPGDRCLVHAAAGGVWLLLVGPRRAAVTAMATYSSMALLYEWTHFLVHTGVPPRSAFAKRVRRNHRLHHFRNEAYWLGFTWPDVDRWLGTEPDPASVPRSPTAMDLFGLEAASDPSGSR